MYGPSTATQAGLDDASDAGQGSPDILRARGYRVEVMEFVDSAHTPRNTLIRAVRTGVNQPDGSAELVATLGLQPRLVELLAAAGSQT